RRIRVDVDEYLLDRDLGRPLLGDHVREIAHDHAQAQRQARAARANAAADDVGELPAARFEKAESRHAKAGVDAEDSAGGDGGYPGRGAPSRAYASSMTADVLTLCTSSRDSSASSSFCIRCASSPRISTSDKGFIVTSANSGLNPFLASASFTAMKSAGAVTTSTLPSSCAITSSAPASIAASISASSSTPGANTTWPQCRNRYATEPSVPRLPPYFENAWRTSATVRVRLSVMQSTITAAPLMP